MIVQEQENTGTLKWRLEVKKNTDKKESLGIEKLKSKTLKFCRQHIKLQLRGRNYKGNDGG